MRGKTGFQVRLTRAHAGRFSETTEADLQRVLGRLTLNPGARTLAQTMKSHGAHTAPISGGFTFFTSAVAGRAGFAANRGNVLLWDDDRLAGAAEPIQGRFAKLAASNEEAAAHGISHGRGDRGWRRRERPRHAEGRRVGVAYRAKLIVAALKWTRGAIYRPDRASLFPGIYGCDSFGG